MKAFWCDEAPTRPPLSRQGRGRNFHLCDKATAAVRKSTVENIVSGAFAVGVDRMQLNFEPMRKQVEAWQRCELTDVRAKAVIYEAFIEDKLEAPKHLARTVHDLYFEPKYEEFARERSGVFRMPSLRR